MGRTVALVALGRAGLTPELADGSTMSSDVGRVVALGASNLTRGFQTVVATARAAWGPDVQVVAALGHGRSYGACSRLIVRTLPGILESRLWQQLESSPPVPTRGLVTDVGNDILYGFSAEQILAWVEEVLGRLQRLTSDIVLTDLPLESIRRISVSKFLVFRSILVPSCRLSRGEVLETAEQVNAGLAALAEARKVRLFHLDPSWYGLDPIHIRPALWRPAWQGILGASAAAGRSRTEALRLYFMRPEKQWLFGLEQVTPQPGTALRSGARVWLY
jgi:hypothetical protein